MSDELRRALLEIDGRGYKAYKSIAGRYAFPGFELGIEHVQGDPYAAPSRLHALVPAAEAAFPADLLRPGPRRRSLCDYLARAFAAAAAAARRDRGSGKSGLVAIDSPGQQVLQRSSVLVRDDGAVEARFVAGLPARGRRVRGEQAAEMLCDDVPALVRRCLRHRALDGDRLGRHADTVEDAQALRAQLRERGLVAFVAEGSSLPRRSGVDDRPLERDVVRFRSPASLRVTLEAPNSGAVEGMGIPEGVTLIVGGGYHGKSTLLQALARGVYDHVPGDGREAVVADPATAKIRAEDGRRVCGVDISAFIADLPGSVDTRAFSTDDASGSTSQAAAIAEALEAGARVLLVDEDTSATNFMIRDHRMQELVARDAEPITPFIDRVRELYERHGVSTVLVTGGSGDYLDVADTVVAMRDYEPRDVTDRAREIARQHPTGRRREVTTELRSPSPRAPLPDSLDPRRGRRPVKLRVRDATEIGFGQERIDLSAVEQLVDASQARAVAEAMVWAKRECMDGRRPLAAVLDRVQRALDDGGLDVLTPWPRGDLARFRRLELAAAINRLRSLQVRPAGDGENGG